MAHKKEPLGRRSSRLLKNRFVYLSHDDGWYNKVYYRRISDFVGMLSKVIPYKLGSFGRKRFAFFPKIENLSSNFKGSYPWASAVYGRWVILRLSRKIRIKKRS